MWSLLLLGVLTAISGHGPAMSPPEGTCMTAAIRIYEPDGEPLPTMDSVFEEHILPELEAADQLATIKNYRAALRKFSTFCTVRKSTASTPSQPPKLTDALFLEWQQWMVNDQKVMASTVNKHWKQLRAILNRMGPRTKGSPNGMGLIAVVPHVKHLRQRPTAKKVVPLPLLDAIYRYGTADMPWPVEQSTKLWRAWLVCTYNLAMRTRDLLGLRWENVYWQQESLDPESVNVSEYGWVQWTPDKTEDKQLTLPLNVHVHDHLRALEGIDDTFVFGRELGQVTDNQLYDKSGRPGQWTQLQDLAATHYGHFDRFEIRTIRRTANTQYNRLHRGLGGYVLGHTAKSVNDMFYQQWEADVIAYVGKLPQPKSFTDPPDPIRQNLLF